MGIQCCRYDKGHVAFGEEVAMASTTVRVDERTRELLREWSKEQRRPIGEIIAEMVEQQQKERFWREMHEDFARLRADPDAWQGYQDELADWDATLMDGLEDEEPYYGEAEEKSGADAGVR
jgi:hypothetical protein